MLDSVQRLEMTMHLIARRVSSAFDEDQNIGSQVLILLGNPDKRIDLHQTPHQQPSRPGSATHPFVLALADKGLRGALNADEHLRNGLNVHDGDVSRGGGGAEVAVHADLGALIFESVIDAPLRLRPDFADLLRQAMRALSSHPSRPSRDAKSSET